jgi:DinB superfamily
MASACFYTPGREHGKQNEVIMQFESVADIYNANARSRTKLIAMLQEVSESEAKCLPDNEKWSVREIVEHVAIVNEGIARICDRLLQQAAAEENTSDGRVSVSSSFAGRLAEIATMKVEAPERVHPTGVITVDESLQRIEAATRLFYNLKAGLERYDVSGPKFPHPFFGDLTAVEWLIVAGGHEARHTAQIQNLLDKIRK